MGPEPDVQMQEITPNALRSADHVGRMATGVTVAMPTSQEL